MKKILFLLLFTSLTGCTTVSELERVKRGEGEYVLFDVAHTRLLELAKNAFKEVGLVVKRVNDKRDRIEILGYKPSELGEYGAVYGLYLYPVGPRETEVYLVRKKRYPTEAFSSDVRVELLSKLDELVLKERTE